MAVFVTVVVAVDVAVGAAGVPVLDVAEAEPVPSAFVAVTMNVYPTPLERPVTTALVAPGPAVAVKPPGFAVTVYEVIGDPPLFAGAVHVTVDCVFSPEDAVPISGASGTVAGIAVVDADEEAPVPETFVAVTVNV